MRRPAPASSWPAYWRPGVKEAARVQSALVLAILAFSIYWFYGRRRVQSESALLHLVQRLTARELVTGSLEAEIEEIIRERDEIAMDRFDKLIERCPVLDLREGMSREDFFEKAAESLAPRLNEPPERIARLLRKREEESSTVLSPQWAVPHLILEGAPSFEILVARCKAGVRFSPEAPAAQALVVMVGSKRERTFHLRCLAAIAQIAQSPGFDRRWQSAPNEQALRDLLLLAQRSRQPALDARR